MTNDVTSLNLVKPASLPINNEKGPSWFALNHLTWSNSVFFLSFFILLLPPPPLGISGLFHLLCSTSYSWSLTFTSTDLPLHVVPDFYLCWNHAGAHGALLVNAHILTNRVTSRCELVTIFFQACEASRHIFSTLCRWETLKSISQRICRERGLNPGPSNLQSK